MFEAGLRAVAASSQTFLRLNERGMLSLAHKIETEDGAHTIINFTIMPDESTGEEKLSQASTADNGSIAPSNQGSDVVTTRRGATSNRSLISRSGGTSIQRGAVDDLAEFAVAAHRMSGAALQGVNYLAGDFLSASGDENAFTGQSAEVEY
jgi:cytolysin (calcineurin-like family phosphatase)